MTQNRQRYKRKDASFRLEIEAAVDTSTLGGLVPIPTRMGDAAGNLTGLSRRARPVAARRSRRERAGYPPR
ncbi:MAG: hypothetical protein ACLPTZ_17200 [Beijerinckiaceae bacterium]